MAFLPNINLAGLNPFAGGDKGYSAGQVATGSKEYLQSKLPQGGTSAPSQPQVMGASVVANRNDGGGDTPADPGVVGSGGYGYGSGSNQTYNPDDIAYIDSQMNQLRDMLGRSQNTLNQGLTNLGDEYNRQTSKANQDRSRFLEDVDTKTRQTDMGKQEALGKVDTNARVLNDSLRRKIGMSSGSDSSAYQYAAPNAVAREATGERTDVLGNYAENMGALDTTKRRGSEDFAALLDDLARQRNQSESTLRSGVLENEQSINSSLAEMAAKRAQAMGGGFGAVRSAMQPYESAISDRRNQIDSLFERFRSPMLTPKAVNVQTPDLKQYLVDRAGINTAAQTGSTSPYEPYYSSLKKQTEDQLV